MSLNLKEETMLPCTKPYQLTLNDCLACSSCVSASEKSILEKKINIKLLENEFIYIIAPHSKINILNTINIAYQHSLSYETFENFLALFIFEKYKSLIIDVSHVYPLLYKKTFEAIKNNKMVITSSCPATVAYVERRSQHLVDNLLKLKSPHQILGKLIEIKRKIAIVPCFDKKLENDNYFEHIIGTNEFLNFLIENNFSDFLKSQKHSKNNVSSFENETKILNKCDVVDKFNEKNINCNYNLSSNIDKTLLSKNSQIDNSTVIQNDIPNLRNDFKNKNFDKYSENLVKNYDSKLFDKMFDINKKKFILNMNEDFKNGSIGIISKQENKSKSLEIGIEKNNLEVDKNENKYILEKQNGYLDEGFYKLCSNGDFKTKINAKNLKKRHDVENKIYNAQSYQKIELDIKKNNNNSDFVFSAPPDEHSFDDTIHTKLDVMTNIKNRKFYKNDFLRNKTNIIQILMDDNLDFELILANSLHRSAQIDEKYIEFLIYKLKPTNISTKSKNKDLTVYKIFCGEKRYKFARIFCLENVINFMNMSKKTSQYDFVEVFVCSSSCINGPTQTTGHLDIDVNLVTEIENKDFDKDFEHEQIDTETLFERNFNSLKHKTKKYNVEW
ncbi:hypothetical protein EDEG_00876 [Edhazardia aedis USNM 41457]|uniref:Iron hydrogenase large subunit C-terminal domain-containing protein n=1 Tax=Edhazardia aedis (strain USNM 41457) TaxID=1003232 RepID=J8ZZC6_EDHAE|nr:hypothetical protein EDEG_00876 [Edhazardia aedis USNM 41457]|eukprot:EJW05023.1 hypothetical protein EDEG_00876 [Edhazardia aedis USNM 41457]